ncbi:MAG: hypothetical protein IPJ41_00180 [Phycisphaerales bacterium]|nr:hypothetical protein [Phycisphaerales bacterium]
MATIGGTVNIRVPGAGSSLGPRRHAGPMAPGSRAEIPPIEQGAFSRIRAGRNPDIRGA